MTSSERRAQNSRKAYKREKYVAKYKAERRDKVAGFSGCKDCRTCRKVGCRHNHNEMIA